MARSEKVVDDAMIYLMLDKDLSIPFSLVHMGPQVKRLNQNIISGLQSFLSIWICTTLYYMHAVPYMKPLVSYTVEECNSH